MSRRKIIARLPDMLKYNAQIKKIVYFFLCGSEILCNFAKSLLKSLTVFNKLVF